MVVEIMAPAGSFESLMAAINSGADSVYFGVDRLNMRAHSANNFKITDLEKVVSTCEKNNVKTYLTLNTVMYDQDISTIKEVCDEAKKQGITAVIACDMAVINYANSIGLEVHTSTQLNVSNIEAVKFFSRYSDVVVLARELSLDQIKEICEQIKTQDIRGPKGQLVKIEIFVHGALCVSISGKCYMSLALYNKSANRGECLQTCRRSYLVKDEDTGDELSVGNKFVMSPRDLCTIGFLDKIIESGVSVLKIEGRGRPADYVDTVVRVYKKARDSYYKGEYTPDKIDKWVNELGAVFNRGFWQGGYYLGKKLGEWSGIYGSLATKKKVFAGIVKKSENNKAKILLQAMGLEFGDEVAIIGPGTGVYRTKVKEFFVNNEKVSKANKGDAVVIEINEKLKSGDQVYLIKEKEEKK